MIPIGSHQNITFDKFPRQGDNLHERVMVTFHYQAPKHILGTVVRDDREDPFQMIIRLDDGRYITASECQWTWAKPPTVDNKDVK